MHFNIFIFGFLAAALSTSLSDADLFSSDGSSSSSSDLSLFPWEISSDSGPSFLDTSTNNDDFLAFADDTTADPPNLTFSMDTGSLEEDPFFPDFLASCPSTNGPPASKKVRARDGETCAPNGQASLSIDSFPDSVLGIFGSPSDREQKLQGAAAAAAGVTKNNGPPCDYFDVEHPFHLCCASEGMPSNTLLPKRPNTGWLGHIGAFLRQDVYINMEDCQSANILPCTAPRAFEVCCQSVSRANDPDALIQGVEQIFNREKPQSLEEFLRKVDEVYGDGQTWLTGEFCYPAGISNR